MLLHRLVECPMPQAQGPVTDLALHTLGWKAFQDLCAQTCEEILKLPVETYREAQDGGQDAAFVSRSSNGAIQHPATIQSKFSSLSGRKFTRADLTSEIPTIRKLVSEGLAHTYVVMTNMGVDAPIAVDIKRLLRSVGIAKPHVFGKEYFTRVIRANARLRALVPRVYGLGDLSQILDERQAAQTKALLGHMLPTLKVYVPTSPHIEAVKKLKKIGIVLLLGYPATGKSTIAAMLATTASEDLSHRCYKEDGPSQFLDHWNPHESNAFYWIDDAFGANQLREDFIDQWIALMPKIQAAVALGCKFVLTSRRHIYLAAKPKLGSRNHPLIHDGQAIVDVGELTDKEREQILYNHIKLGTQSRQWKQFVKPHLLDLSKETMLLPEIARRLGDANYTKKLTIIKSALLDFVRRPREHLIQTLEELSRSHLAGLTLIFLHRGKMMVGDPNVNAQRLIGEYFGVDPILLSRSLRELIDSFIVLSGDGAFWSFKHPTIVDAISAILARTEGMTELYLRGSEVEKIMSEAICSGADPIQDAVMVPSGLYNLLTDRLLETPDEPRSNARLFNFLNRRTNIEFLRNMLSSHPGILNRNSGPYFGKLVHDPKIILHSKAHSLGLLPEYVRNITVATLEEAARSDSDVSFMDSDVVLDMMHSRQLIRMYRYAKEFLEQTVSVRVEDVVDDADLDADASSQFSDVRSSIAKLEWLFEDDEDEYIAIEEAYKAIEVGVAEIEEKQKRAEKENEHDDNWEWQKRAPAQVGGSNPLAVRASGGPRSIFSDVDE